MIKYYNNSVKKMISRNYFRYFVIAGLLNIFFILCLSSPVSTQPKTVTIVIKDFEAPSSIPPEFQFIKLNGASMLIEDLLKAASTAKTVNFTLLERGKDVNKFIEEKQIRESLSRRPAEYKQTAQSDKGAEYIIYADIFPFSDNCIRVAAKMAKVETYAVEISKSCVFCTKDPSPMQDLADQLVTAYREKFLNEIVSKIDHYYVVLIRFEGPPKWEKKKDIIHNYLKFGLISMQNIKCKSSDNIDIKEKTNSQLIDMYPTVDYIIISEIKIAEEENKAFINIQAIDKDNKPQDMVCGNYKPDELLDAKVLQELVTEFINKFSRDKLGDKK